VSGRLGRGRKDPAHFDHPRSVDAEAAAFVGQEFFTYQVSDGKGGTANGTVTVTVTPLEHLVWSQNPDNIGLFLHETSAEPPGQRHTTQGLGNKAPAAVLVMPDGRHIAYQVADGGLYLADPSSNITPFELTPSSAVGRVTLASAVHVPLIVYATITTAENGFNWTLTQVNVRTLQQTVLVEGIVGVQKEAVLAARPEVLGGIGRRTVCVPLCGGSRAGDQQCRHEDQAECLVPHGDFLVEECTLQR
jgi:hypothetical protein